MPGFKFELSQIVMVPGKNQQGRISGRMEYVDRETVYQVKWLDADLLVYAEMFSESELTAAANDRFTDLVIDWTEVQRAAREKTIAASGPVLATALKRATPAPRRKRNRKPVSRSRRKSPSRKAKRKARG